MLTTFGSGRMISINGTISLSYNTFLKYLVSTDVNMTDLVTVYPIMPPFVFSIGNLRLSEAPVSELNCERKSTSFVNSNFFPFEDENCVDFLTTGRYSSSGFPSAPIGTFTLRSASHMDAFLPGILTPMFFAMAIIFFLS